MPIAPVKVGVLLSVCGFIVVGFCSSSGAIVDVVIVVVVIVGCVIDSVVAVVVVVAVVGFVIFAVVAAVVSTCVLLEITGVVVVSSTRYELSS